MPGGVPSVPTQAPERDSFLDLDKEPTVFIFPPNYLEAFSSEIRDGWGNVWS